MKSLLGACAAAVILGVAAFLLDGTQARAAGCWHWVASWYGTESGNRTANGEPFDGSSLTAAHRTMPFGTRLKVIYQGREVVVRINDRGPFIRGRQLDLSEAAARRIGLTRAGVGRVKACRL